MTYRQGKEDMRDEVIAIIIGMQFEERDRASERYQAMQDVIKTIIKTYGGIFEPLKGESE